MRGGRGGETPSIVAALSKHVPIHLPAEGPSENRKLVQKSE